MICDPAFTRIAQPWRYISDADRKHARQLLDQLRTRIDKLHSKMSAAERQNLQETLDTVDEWINTPGFSDAALLLRTLFGLSAVLLIDNPAASQSGQALAGTRHHSSREAKKRAREWFCQNGHEYLWRGQPNRTKCAYIITQLGIADPYPEKTIRDWLQGYKCPE